MSITIAYNKWDDILKDYLESPDFINMIHSIELDAKQHRIYPDRKNVFKALELCDYDNVKVVILGQDPYHGPNQATGLAFGVSNDVYPKPPSLINIMKEANGPRFGSSLEDWANQGVLLLNTILTVRSGKPLSHKDWGWEKFTDRIIGKLDNSSRPLVFMLWGNSAQEKEKFITNKRHLILKTTHPSPLSAHKGFLGCGHFEKANEFLKEGAINWQMT